MTRTTRIPLTFAAAFAALAVAAPPASANGDDAPAPRAQPRAATLKVMTRNIYLGADISKPIGQTGDAFVQANTEVWDMVRETNFPARAPRLAREIARTKPDLIGLQEVALWRRGAQGVSDGPQTPARQVVYDFLRILRRALADRGLRYRLGSVQNEADVEGPTTYGYDVRLTMRDAILVKRRKGLRIRRRSGDNFTAAFTVPTPVGVYNVLRGWTAVDMSYRGRRFRFLDTHLEAYIPAVRQAQAAELVAPGGPADRARVILVGDLNSEPQARDSGDPVPYQTLTGAGFRDTWDLRHGSRLANSCCMDQENIKDPPPAPFDHHIDHILVKPRMKTLSNKIVGNDRRNRTRSGLWPSDHGGHVAKLRLPRR
jgi:endonuclease/exonuclease/phosphatase family metal-dependent hydrolase